MPRFISPDDSIHVLEADPESSTNVDATSSRAYGSFKNAVLDQGMVSNKIAHLVKVVDGERSDIIIGGPCATKVAAIVMHPRFEAATACLISLNVVYMGYTANHDMQHWQTVSDSGVRLLIDGVFASVYSLESLTRLIAFGYQFWCGPDRWWNMFDLVLA